MKNKKRKSAIISKKIKKTFSGKRITKYSGLEPVINYIKATGIIKMIETLFPSKIYNATKHTNVQILLSIVLSSLSNINRMCRIENFTSDILVEKLLNLTNRIDANTISTKLKQLGQAGAIILQEGLFSIVSQWIEKSKLEKLTIDMDSTVSGVYGSQEGSAKGYNPVKKGQRSYHNLLCFASEIKLVLNSWFRDGSAYTSNGACEFMKQTLAALPKSIKKVFVRCDSGFFDGELFDLLEKRGHDYLVKVKLKNLYTLLKDQEWEVVDSKTSQTNFDYRCKGWKKSRTLKAVRIFEKYNYVEMFGEITEVPEYNYFCYCSNIETMNGVELHQLYKKRGESENWIEQAKNQLLASKTLTQSFHANDILWQLSILAYNISVMMRYETNRKFWHQEHKTFREWFIELPGKVIDSGRQIKLKMYENYYHKANWLEVDVKISLMTT